MTRRATRMSSYLSMTLLAWSVWAPALVWAPKAVAAEGAIEGQYLVMLHDDQARDAGDTESARPSVREVVETLAATHRGETVSIFERAFKGALLEISKEDARILARHPSVALVEQNRYVVSEAPTGDIGSCHPDVGTTFYKVMTGGGSQAINCPELDPREPGYDCQGNWGLDRIDQNALPRDGFYDYDFTGDGVRAYIIDTGVNSFADEFDGRIERGVVANVTITSTFDPLRSNTNDCSRHGHGTHVTGIIGSTTWGVAKDAILHPVKFLDYCGCGENWDSDDDCSDATPPHLPSRGGKRDDVIAAIEYIIDYHEANHPEEPAVANLSGANVPGWDNFIASSVQSLLDAGIQFVQAAGNWDNATACTHTIGDEVPDAIVVGGMDINNDNGQLIDGRWRREGPTTTGGPKDPGYDEWCTSGDCGSTTGSCIDVWAPAAHITSTAADASGGCRLSGTSMAAPHVTGAVALFLEEDPDATPQEVQQAIIDRSIVGVLEDSPTSPYSIGNSPNRLLRVGPAALADLAVNLTQSSPGDKSAGNDVTVGKGRRFHNPLPIYVHANVDNLGPDAGQGVELVVVFDEPLYTGVWPLGAAQSCDVAIGPMSTRTYTCNLGTMANGGSTTLTWQISRSPSSQPFQVDATVSSAAQDPVASNNQDSTVVLFQ